MFPFCCYLLQKVSEKVGGAEGTKLDDDFKEMERVSLHFLAFPWHGVCPLEEGSLKLPRTSLQVFCLKTNKQKHAPFTACLEVQTGTQPVFPVSIQRTETLKMNGAVCFP